MGVEDVAYEDAVDAGVMDADDDPIQPEARGMNDDLSMAVGDLDADLMQVLRVGLGDAVQLVDGVLKLKNDAPLSNRALRDCGEAVLRGLQLAMGAA